MKGRKPVAALPALAAAAMIATPFPAAGGSASLFGPPPLQEAIDRGMPHSGRLSFLLLPPKEQGRSKELPRLLRALADAGNEDEALALFEKTRPFLAEPVRSEAFFEAGVIHWEKNDHEGAARALREVDKQAAVAPLAALLSARIAAARGDEAAAASFLQAVPPGPARSLLEGWLQAGRGDQAGAARAWAAVPDGAPEARPARLAAFSAGAPGGPLRAFDATEKEFPERAARDAVAARRHLLAGRFSDARSAATSGLSAAAAWRESIAAMPPWDGTLTGADEAAREAEGLFPYGEDARTFRSAVRALRSAAALHESVRAAENGLRALVRQAAAARRASEAGYREAAERAHRAARHASALEARAAWAAGLRGRLSEAASELFVAELGRTLDPKTAAGLEEADRTLAAASKQLSRARAAAEERRRLDLAPEDLRMVYYAASRLVRIEARLEELAGRVAILRGRAWNRWKEAYAARASAMLATAEEVSRAAAEQARRARDAEAAFTLVAADFDLWRTAARRFEEALRRRGRSLAELRAGAASLAAAAFERTRSELLLAVGRTKRTLAYLAARAATEPLLQDPKPASASPALSAADQRAQRAEAIRLWELVLSPSQEGNPYADEALVTLAELRLEDEYEASGGAGFARGRAASFEAPAALYRELLAAAPRSPYAEQALFGLAFCLEAAGDPDEAASVLSSILARYPKTAHADEIHLWLGEHAFEEDDFRAAEEHYRAVGAGAPAVLRATALFKLGFSLYLQERFDEAADPFFSAFLISSSAASPQSVAKEALAMAARSMVEAKEHDRAFEFTMKHGAPRHSPALLAEIARVLETQNRYADVVAVADRLAAAWPLSAERPSVEAAAARALAAAQEEEKSRARSASFAAVFGPGSAWQAAPGRTAEEIARANALAEAGLAEAAFFFHGRARKNDRAAQAQALSLYDQYLARFPSAPRALEVAYQRAWLLFETGRKKDAKSAFESLAQGKTERAEASRYMAVQCAKDLALPGDPASQQEVVRLCLEYERAHPSGERSGLVLLDRARAHFALRQYQEAERAAERAASRLPPGGDQQGALRLAADARFEAGNYEEAENGYRALYAAAGPAERAELGRWIAYAMFRRAEEEAGVKPGEAAALFLRLAEEFPAIDIAATARFQGGVILTRLGREKEAMAALLPVEREKEGTELGGDAREWLARLYEKAGLFTEAAWRVAKLAGAAQGAKKIAMLEHAAGLYERGREQARARALLAAVGRAPEADPGTRVRAWFRAGRSAEEEGAEAEADACYAEALKVHALAEEAAPETAARAAFRRGEIRFRDYLLMAVGPPIEQSFRAKRAALEEASAFFVEAARLGDDEIVSAALHRLGEGLENFRLAVLASPPPPGLSDRESEEYRFLLEERAAPIEEKAVEAYVRNLREAVRRDFFSPWVGKSAARLKELRPAWFGRRFEWAFPVVAIPDFAGIIERQAP